MDQQPAPMDFRFELQNFAGPLDLLLFLVQREEVDVREISLARICEQYLQVLEEIKKRDIEQAGDFLVMAATLMCIKARALLPHEELDLAQELDPEEELIQQLLEYRKIKEASRYLAGQADSRSLVHTSRPEIADAGIPLDEVDLTDLVSAFRRVLYETGLDRPQGEIISSERSISAYVEDLLQVLRERRSISFFQVFARSRSRRDLIGAFLALLELIKAGVVRAVQEVRYGEIEIQACGEVPDSLTSLAHRLTSDQPEGSWSPEAAPPN